MHILMLGHRRDNPAPAKQNQYSLVSLGVGPNMDGLSILKGVNSQQGKVVQADKSEKIE
jgi:hypothetical protein